MLNISENSIRKYIRLSDFKSHHNLRKNRFKNLPLIMVSGMLITLLISLLFPWTQNINAKGYVTTRLPEQRPQAIQSVIAGRLEKWYVREGDFVEKGDTIVFISEVKNDYFDPNLFSRISEQIDAKSQSVESYNQKIIALQNQYKALEESLHLKEQQTVNKILQGSNKISMDSIDLEAYKVNLNIAKNQYSRTQELYKKGLKTLTELQDKEYKVQAASAKVNLQENKLLNQINELSNLKLELLAIERNYADKLAKSQSDQQSALSDKLESMTATSKLRNKLSNLSQRQQFYYIKAAQSGYITQTMQKGIGETIKEGTDIATIMPSVYDLAVEIYLKPQDLPLISIGNKAQLRFDGWPAIIVSGWPESTTGVFSGEIVAIDQFLSKKGYYRVLISPNNESKHWPDKLRVGTGVETFVLLKEVPIWYEIWRKLNGFPPDYYSNEKMNPEIKQKAPIKKIK